MYTIKLSQGTRIKVEAIRIDKKLSWHFFHTQTEYFGLILLPTSAFLNPKMPKNWFSQKKTSFWPFLDFFALNKSKNL